MISKIIKRSRQFFRALWAKPDTADRTFVDRHLNETEKALFYNMDPAIQKHCVNVAGTAARLAAGLTGDERELLIKAALLHDIGKVRGSFNIVHRVLYVLVNKVSPAAAARLAKAGKNGRSAGLRHAFYIHVHHARLGAETARKAGLAEELVELIRRHHDAAKAGGDKKLAILIKADELN